MTSSSTASDFRPLAASWSSDFLKKNAPKLAENLNCSLCLSRGDEGNQQLESKLRKNSRETTNTLLWLLVAIVVPVACVMFVDIPIPHGTNILAGVMIAASLAAVFFFGHSSAKKNTLEFRSLLAARPDAVQVGDSKPAPQITSVHLVDASENWPSETADIGLLVFDPKRKRIVIEGIRYQYIIHAREFQRIQLDNLFIGRRRQSIMRLVYRVGETQLHLRLKFEGLTERDFVTGAPTPAFLSRFYEALGLPSPFH